MEASGRRIAILVEDDFEDVELTEPMEALKKAGVEMTIVGSGSKKTYRGKRGRATIDAETTADKVDLDEFDAVLIPGGYAPDKMRLYQPMIDLVSRAFRMGKIVAAVCHGPQLLISADVVRGRRVTSWPSVAIDLKNAGAEFVDRPVVKDDNLITSRMPGDLPEFSAAIIEELKKVKEKARS
ncbi:MAG: type 1 glutamine amidotransferase [Dehalococcoidia bacterium]|nr:type 1 glutamine amidotransferase [Dehalococcoidia bacterium]